MSLAFYAGHGLEMDGVNYLVPVDARLERDTDVRFEGIEHDDALAATTGRTETATSSLNDYLVAAGHELGRRARWPVCSADWH